MQHVDAQESRENASLRRSNRYFGCSKGEMDFSHENFKVSSLYRNLNCRVECLVCERKCIIPLEKPGACWNYENRNGMLVHTGYGRISAIESRPIEIKPLFHYWPNSTATTFSNFGCNFYCPWCQNDHLSFQKPPSKYHRVIPEEIVKHAILKGDQGLSASFNEPITNLEYVIDVSRIGVENGLYSMLVTNMYFTENSLKAVIDAGVDGFSADIKGCPSMKKALSGIDHSIVFRNAKKALDLGAHVEMVYLVVTNTNDHDECVEWVIDNHLKFLGPDTPLHVNRYFPSHRWFEPPTPLSKLLDIKDRARHAGLKYVYIGNIGGVEFESTRCPRCGKVLIARRNYRVKLFNLDRDSGIYKCPRCGERILLRGKYVQTS